MVIVVTFNNRGSSVFTNCGNELYSYRCILSNILRLTVQTSILQHYSKTSMEVHIILQELGVNSVSLRRFIRSSRKLSRSFPVENVSINNFTIDAKNGASLFIEHKMFEDEVRSASSFGGAVDSDWTSTITCSTGITKDFELSWSLVT